MNLSLVWVLNIFHALEFWLINITKKNCFAKSEQQRQRCYCLSLYLSLLKRVVSSVVTYIHETCNFQIFKIQANLCMRGSRKFFRGGPISTAFFKLKRGSKYHEKRAIIGPLAKRHLNGVSLPCQWGPNIECWLGSFAIFQGIQTVLLRNPIFCDFSGGGGPLSPLWIRTCFVAEHYGLN